MKKGIQYHLGADYLLVSLGNRIQPKIAILLSAELLCTTGIATVFILRSFPWQGQLTNMVMAIGAIALYVLAFYRFLSRIFFQEQLLIDKEELAIIHQTPFARKNTRYHWHRIGAIRYGGKYKKTAHPLKGECYDYFGFETQEQLLQNLHHDGNLYFLYEGKKIHFARNVYSWDAEKIVYMARLYAGNSVNLGPEWEQMLQEHEVEDY